ncbi:MAG: hypothetical protein SAMD01599839_05460 [Rectinema sp.]
MFVAENSLRGKIFSPLLDGGNKLFPVFKMYIGPGVLISGESGSKVFVPMLQFPRGASVSVSGATVAEPSLKIEGKTHCALAPTEPERYFMLRLDAKPDAQRCRLTILRL